MALAVTGAAVRSSFSDLLEPGMRKIFDDVYSQLPTTYDKIFHVSDSNRQQEYDSGVSGFGQLVKTTEGAAVTYEDPIQLRAQQSIQLIKSYLINWGSLRWALCLL